MQRTHTMFLHSARDCLGRPLRHGRGWWLVIGVLALLMGGGVPLAAAAPAKGTLESRSLRVGALSRSYMMYTPQNTNAGPLPVVIALHGANSNARSMIGLTKFNDVADANAFIVVYPNAITGRWNSGASAALPDDLAFISALLDTLGASPNVDKQRIYVTGFSSGAVMTELVGCRFANRIAAIASVSGHLTADVAATCKPARALPMLTIHGTADPVMEYKGRETAKLGSRFLGAERAFDMWASFAACRDEQDQALADIAPNDGTTVDLFSEQTCTAQTIVYLYRINGGGHTWPDGFQYLPAATIGKTTRDVNGSTSIWSFFNRWRMSRTDNARTQSQPTATATVAKPSPTASATATVAKPSPTASVIPTPATTATPVQRTAPNGTRVETPAVAE